MNGAPISPYAVDWNFGVMPVPGMAVDSALRTAARNIAVIVPDTFIGTVHERREEDGRWLWFGSSDSLHVASDGRYWAVQPVVDGTCAGWSEWQEINTWWVEVTP